MLNSLVKQLEINIKKKSFETTRNTSSAKISIESFRINLSKPIIHELLAKHHGFTEEDLDFIINYGIKYRMGDELNAGRDGPTPQDCPGRDSPAPRIGTHLWQENYWEKIVTSHRKLEASDSPLH